MSEQQPVQSQPIPARSWHEIAPRKKPHTLKPQGLEQLVGGEGCGAEGRGGGSEATAWKAMVGEATLSTVTPSRLLRVPMSLPSSCMVADVLIAADWLVTVMVASTCTLPAVTARKTAVDATPSAAESLVEKAEVLKVSTVPATVKLVSTT